MKIKRFFVSLLSLILVITLFGFNDMDTMAQDVELEIIESDPDDDDISVTEIENESIIETEIKEENTTDAALTDNYDLDAALEENYDDELLGASDSDYTTITFTKEVSVTSKEAILNRINEIRLEAYNEGLIASYTPIKWSSDMEEIAFQRAAEASVFWGHTRPDGTSYFTCKASSGSGSSGEIIASPSNEISAINLWYTEKDAYVNNTGGVTGHYEQLIKSNYIGIASCGVTAGETSGSQKGTEEQKCTSGEKTVSIRVSKANLSNFTVGFDGADSDGSVSVNIGSTKKITPKLTSSKGWSRSNGVIGLTGSFNYTSADDSIAKVDNNGNIKGVSLGSTTITFSNGDFTESVVVNVKQPVTSITLNQTSINLNRYDTYTLIATVNPDNATNKEISWSSSSSSIASVDSSGKITARSVGTVTITATAKDGSGKSASCTVTVKQPVTAITLSKTRLTLNVKDTQTITPTIYPSGASDKTVTWTSSDSNVATVDADGKITAKSAGTATITATANDGSGKSAECIVTVKQPVESITLDKNTITLNVYNSQILTATVKPDNASNKSVTWTSSDTNVAYVSSSGKVTGYQAGTATITATAKDGSGKSATCTVTVKQPVTSIKLNNTTLKLNVNDTQTLTATINPDNASNKAVTWSSSNTSVATVDSNGKITAKSAGTAVITIKANDGSGVSATCTVAVIQPVTSVSLDKSSLSLNIYDSQVLTATVKPDDASNKSVTWTSSDINVAYVSSSGKVIAYQVGTATITATAKDGSGKSATCSVIVKQPVTVVELNKTQLSLNVNDTQTIYSFTFPLDASDKTVSWSSSNTSVATVDSNGKITAKSAGTAVITVKANDGSGESATCTVTVKQPVTGITLDKSSITINVNTTQTLSATITPSNASDKSLAWTSSNANVATVDSTGKVTAKSAGTATITAKANDGSGKNATCTVTVNANTQPEDSNIDNNPSKDDENNDDSNSNINDDPSSNTDPSSNDNPISNTKNVGNDTNAYVSMYRLYNPNSGEHFYTANEKERNNLVSVGWRYEGIGWKAPAKSNTPVYRLYNKNAGDHHYTMSEKEKDFLVSVGWKYEGIGWYSDDAKSVPLYRQYNPNAKAGSHNYTTSKAENDNLVKLGWRGEGTGWYGVK